MRLRTFIISNRCLNKVVVFLSIKIVLGKPTFDLCCAAVPIEKMLNPSRG